MQKYLYVLLLIFASIFIIASTEPEAEESLSIVHQEQVNKAAPVGFFSGPVDNSMEYMLTIGVLRAKTKAGIWYQCGELVKHEDWYDKAVEISKASISSALPRGVDPVGQLATWLHESGVDPCAVGPHVRNLAITHGILKAKRTTLSYTKKEVLHALTHPKLKSRFRVVDVGLAQTLYPLYTHGATLEEMLSINPGAVYSAKEFQYRSKAFKTAEPWITWPGRKSAKRKAIINYWVYKIMEIDFVFPL